MSPFDSTEEELFEPTDSPDEEEEEAQEEVINEEDYTSLEDYAAIISEYWPLAEPEKLFATLKEKEEECHRAFERRGLISMGRLVYSQYFGMSNSTGSGPGGAWETQSIQFEGENGELLVLSVNEFRSYCDQIFDMTTKHRPTFEAQAINTDVDSLSQVESSSNYLQYYYEQEFGERNEKEVVKYEGMYGKGWTHIEWDDDDGPDVEIDTEIDSPVGPLPAKEKVKSGALLISSHYPWEVIHEPYRSETKKHLWRMVLSQRSKWEMIARYPLFAQKIKQSGYEGPSREYSFPGADGARNDSDDLLTIRTFYHAKCGAIPLGKKIVYVGCVQVVNIDLPVDDLPLIDLMSSELHGTSFGISNLWNLIPLNQLKSQVMSDMATNIEAFGRPPLVLEEGQDIDLDALANGQHVITIPPNSTRPEPLKFPSIPDASFKVVELLRLLEQSVSGLNATFRGEPGNNVSSGAMAALFDNRAVDNQSPRQGALDLMRERIGNIILQYVKRYAKHPQLVAVTGKDEKSYIESFTKEDVAGVHRVVVKTGGNTLRTPAQRTGMAEMLKSWPGNPLSDPAQIITLMTTGQFKPMYNSNRVSELRIRAENELLMEGPPTQTSQDIDPATGLPALDPMTGTPIMKTTVPTVPVYATDPPREHIVGALEVLNSPAAQKNPAIVDACLAHILEHVQVARTNDPYLCAILGLPPPQSAMGDPASAETPPTNGETPPSSSKKKEVQDTSEADDSMGGMLPSAAKPPASSNLA